MSRWVCVITKNAVLERFVFTDPDVLRKEMKSVVEASQFWGVRRFSMWVRSAKPGEWVEMRDEHNRIRVLIVRSRSDIGAWQEGDE